MKKLNIRGLELQVFCCSLSSKIDVLVRKSNAYVPCGATSKRDISAQWILRCLRLHGHRFEKHYAFMLLAFDFLATKMRERRCM